MSGTPAPASATLDAALLYWTRLPPEAGRLGARRRQFRFERVLPVPVESLHLASVDLADGGVLLVGIEPERLRAHLAQRPDLGPGTWELLPDRVPAHLAAPETLAALPKLNLLHAAFEPAARRRLRRWRDLAAGAGLAAALLLVLVGIERRVLANETAVEALGRQRQELLASSLGPSADGLPEAARLTQELRRLEQAARTPAAAPLDATRILQQLWAAWPKDVRTQVETLSLTGERLVIRGSVPSLADAERVAKACPMIETGGRVLRAAPLQAEQGQRSASFLLTWTLPTTAGPGRRP